MYKQHHEEMDEIDKRRKKDFQKHEMEKEHKRRVEEKSFDEKKKKEVEEERKRLREKHLEDAKRVNHPVSKNNIIHKTDREFTCLALWKHHVNLFLHNKFTWCFHKARQVLYSPCKRTRN